MEFLFQLETWISVWDGFWLTFKSIIGIAYFVSLFLGMYCVHHILKYGQTP